MAGDPERPQKKDEIPEEEHRRTTVKLYIAYLLSILIAAAAFGALGFYLLPSLLTIAVLSAGYMALVGILVGLETAFIIEALILNKDENDPKYRVTFPNQTQLSYAIIGLGMSLGVIAELLFHIIFPVVFAFAGPIGAPILLTMLGLIASLAAIGATFLAADLLGSNHAFAKLALAQPFSLLSRLFGLEPKPAKEPDKDKGFGVQENQEKANTPELKDDKTELKQPKPPQPTKKRGEEEEQNKLEVEKKDKGKEKKEEKEQKVEPLDPKSSQPNSGNAKGPDKEPSSAGLVINAIGGSKDGSGPSPSSSPTSPPAISQSGAGFTGLVSGQHGGQPNSKMDAKAVEADPELVAAIPTPEAGKKGYE